MRARSAIAIRVVLVAVPLLLLVLWLASGREFHTSANRVVAVQVYDELFGDTSVEQRIVRGPIFGYYIGTDALILSCVAVLVLTAILSWRGHHRRRWPAGLEGQV